MPPTGFDVHAELVSFVAKANSAQSDNIRDWSPGRGKFGGGSNSLKVRSIPVCGTFVPTVGICHKVAISAEVSRKLPLGLLLHKENG